MDERFEKSYDEIKVSIVIPVYNVSAYIERCLKSVMSQTYSNIECILVDDVTPDDSIEICERLIDEYQGPITFKILHHKKNRGLSAARNTGTESSTGDYLYYLDSDDEISCDCIEKLIEPVLLDSSVEIVQGNIEKVPNIENTYYYDLNVIGLPSLEMTTNKEIRKWYYVNYMPRPRNAWNKLIRKDFVLKYKLYFREGIIHEDDMWMFYVLKYLKHIYFLYDKTYIHYVTEGSIMTGKNRNKSYYSWSEIIKEAFGNLTSYDKETEIKYFVNKYLDYYKIFRDTDIIDDQGVYKVVYKAICDAGLKKLSRRVYFTNLLKGVGCTYTLAYLLFRE